jgi:hypothetical protein
MEDNNFYRTDQVAIYEQQEIRVGNSISEIESNCNTSPITFLSGLNNVKKIKDRSTEVDIKQLIGTVLVKISMLSGIKNQIDDFNKQDILKMILSAYNGLTIEEIYKAFELERYGKYEVKTDHYQLFNADYISKILIKYKKWKQDVRIQHNISSENLIPALPEKTTSQLREIMSDGIIRTYNEYLENGEIPELSAHIFDELLERGIIKGSNTPALSKYYLDKVEQARIEIKSELKRIKTSSPSEANNIKLELEKIQNESSSKVQIRAKKIVLKEFFQKQKSLGTDMKKLIE